MCLKIILKFTKKQDFTLSLEDTFFKKPHGGRDEIDPPAVLGLIGVQNICIKVKISDIRKSFLHLVKVILTWLLL